MGLFWVRCFISVVWSEQGDIVGLWYAGQMSEFVPAVSTPEPADGRCSV